MRECTHPITIITVRTKKNGVKCVTRQCTYCGNSQGELPKAGTNLALLPPFDEELRQSWWDEICRQSREESDRERGLRRAEWFAQYNLYLATPHWRRIRAIVLARDPVCQCCFERPSEQAHHLSYYSYDKFGFSFAIECAGVCTFCHQQKMHPDNDSNP